MTDADIQTMFDQRDRAEPAEADRIDCLIDNALRKQFSERQRAHSPEAPAQTWIKVSERLPDRERRVLLWDADNTGGGSVAFGFRISANNAKTVKWQAENYGYDGCHGDAYGVTHWMPEPGDPLKAKKSDTPLTDEIMDWNIQPPHDTQERYEQMYDHARKLERLCKSRTTA